MGETRYYAPGEAVVRPFTRRDGMVVLCGVAAGAIAAIPMLVALTVAAVLQGQEAWKPLALIAATTDPSLAVALTPGAILVGLLLHLVVGIGYGVVFGYIADELPTAEMVIAGGFVYSVIVFLVMHGLVVPNLSPMLGEQLSWSSVLVAHLAYGAGLAVYWPLHRRLVDPRKREDPIPLPVIG